MTSSDPNLTPDTTVRLSFRAHAIGLGTIGTLLLAVAAAYFRLDARVASLESYTYETKQERAEMRTAITDLTRTVDRWIGERRRADKGPN